MTFMYSYCFTFHRFSFSPEELSSSLPANSSSMILSPPNTPTLKSQLSHQQSHQNQPTSSQSLKKSKPGKQKPNNTHQNSNKPAKTSKVPLDPDRPKRPMNAFMLFAKEHRLKLIRMHPGKDNRFVSSFAAT